MEVAPPFPRAERTTRDSRWVTSCEDPSNVARRYGYGFPLYQVQEAKKEVFERLFAGPLNPGLLDVLPSDYPYLASEKDPFPKFVNGCSPAN